MRTEREREAREHRSQGNELAETIKANADREQKVLLADAYRQAETLPVKVMQRLPLLPLLRLAKMPSFIAFIAPCKLIAIALISLMISWC